MAHPALLALAAIGAIVVFRFLHATAQFLTFHLLTPSSPLQKYKRANTTAYALITGSSAGIGRGIAQELITQGFGVILHSHLPEELASTAATLRKSHPAAQVHTLTLDALTATPSSLSASLEPLLTTLPITILVNNIGGNPVSQPAFRAHGTYTSEDVDAVINQNARFMARLTALLLPTLTTSPLAPRQPGERSLIVTLSSGAHVGVPWLVMYGATKAFNRAFGVGLARELEGCAETAHVDSIVVVPGEVVSQGNCLDVPAGSPTWDQFGRDIVRKVDGAVGRGWREMHPFWRHGVENVLLTMVPEGVRTKGVGDQLGRKKRAWDESYAKSR